MQPDRTEVGLMQAISGMLIWLSGSDKKDFLLQEGSAVSRYGKRQQERKDVDTDVNAEADFVLL